MAEKGHGWGATEAARVFGAYTADVLAANDDFRIFGPDETASNRLQDAYAATKKQCSRVITRMPTTTTCSRLRAA